MIILQSPFPVQTQSAEALAFFARLGTQPTDERKTIYDRLISGLVYSGVWAKLDALYIFAAADAATARTNLKQTSFGATVVGSPVFAADQGYTGLNTNTDYLETGFDPTVGTPNFSRNSAGHFAWKATNVADDDGGLLKIDGNTYLRPRRADNIFYSSASGGGTSVTVLANNTGLFAASRPDSTNTRAYLRGVLAVSTPANNSTPFVAARTIKFLGGPSVLTIFSKAQIAAGGYGSNLTSADHRNLSVYLQNYLTDMLGGVRPLQLLFGSDIVNDGLGNITPGLARLADGRLFAVYSVGVAQDNAKAVYQTSSDHGKTWSAAIDVAIPAALHTYTDTNATVLADGTILVSVMYNANDASTVRTKVLRGTVAGDLSISWVEVSVSGSNRGTSSYVLKLANGTLMLGVYGFPASNISVFFSSDGGTTWGGEVVIVGVPVAGDAFTESNFVQLANGNIFGILRNDNITTPSRTGYWRTLSTDNGATWSAPTQIFNNTIAGAPSRPAPVLTPTGTIFLFTRFTSPIDNNRTGYTYSTDSGATWSTPVIYFEVSGKSYGQHISAQGFYDTVTSTLMYILGQGTFSAAQINFQQFYLP